VVVTKGSLSMLRRGGGEREALIDGESGGEVAVSRVTRCFGDMRRDNAREWTGCVGATDTGQLLQPQGLDVMSSLVRATYLCGARPGQHSEQRLDGGRPGLVQRLGGEAC
jgi:hypothetical protein